MKNEETGTTASDNFDVMKIIIPIFVKSMNFYYLNKQIRRL